MAVKRRRARVDPALQQELKAAASGAVEAVFRLRPSRRGALVPPPEETRGLAEGVLTRVAQELGASTSGYDFNVFPNLGYFVLSAPAAFVERVLRQPEVASASANRRR